eukprot:768531-Hanusia_phi.AAC.4
MPIRSRGGFELVDICTCPSAYPPSVCVLSRLSLLLLSPRPIGLFFPSPPFLSLPLPLLLFLLRMPGLVVPDPVPFVPFIPTPTSFRHHASTGTAT